MGRWSAEALRRNAGLGRRQARTRRDNAIARAYRDGATLAELAVRHGLSPSGVSRILARLDARATADERRRREAAWRAMGRTRGPRPMRRDADPIMTTAPAPRGDILPGCPAHLRRLYPKIRAVLGADLARAQLLAMAAREKGQDTGDKS